jgi:uncharacterized membrane protein
MYLWVGIIFYKSDNSEVKKEKYMKNRSLLGPFLFGAGIIGMLDGILFHQILQWHSVYMPTDRTHQIVSDGLFHLFVTAFIFISGLILWRSNSDKIKYPNRFFWGGFFLGAGTFNFLEGIIDHHLLKIHHVKPGDPHQFQYDLAYDALAILIFFFGWFLYRSSKKG